MFNRLKFEKINNDSKYHVAFVIDKEVVDIIRCNVRLFSILTSNPIVVGFVPEDGKPVPKPGWKFYDNEFHPIEYNIQGTEEHQHEKQEANN